MAFETTLPGSFFHDPAIFAREQGRIFGRMWVCAGRADDIPHPGDGAFAGYVTSAGFGYSVDGSTIYGYLPAAHRAPGTPVAIDSFGARYPATVASDP